MSDEKSFWNFNAADVIKFVVLVGALFGMWFTLVNRVSNVEKDEVLLQAAVRMMDEKGTQASQRGIYQESEQSKGNQRRLEELETEWHDLAPKVERIDVNLQWLLKNSEKPSK